MSVFPTIKIFSPAKINLHLDVVSKRGDGFHNIESLMQAIDCKDCLELRPSAKFCLEFLPESSFPVKSLHYDLYRDSAFPVIYQEAQKTFEHLPKGCDLTITKNIPIGAGLGGASSNIASFLFSIAVWTEKEFHNKKEVYFDDFSEKKQKWLKDTGKKYGSDVPFFFEGGLALVTGRGENIVSLPSVGDKMALVYYCGEHISTHEAYQDLSRSIFDNADEENRQKARDLLKKLQQEMCVISGENTEEVEQNRYALLKSFLHDVGRNDFFYQNFPTNAILSQAWHLLGNCIKKLPEKQRGLLGENYISMSGSGSSLYALFHGTICPTEEAELSRFFLNKNKVFADKLSTSLPSCLFLTRFCTKGIFARCTWD